MNTAWQIRFVGTPGQQDLPTARHVLEGLRDGEWDTGDEVRGPGETAWVAIEDHPQFADAVAEMGAAPKVEVDESRLDMNPLIDVSLVLLIFFILTTTYASLKRSIDVPAEPEDKKKQVPAPTLDELKDRTFHITAWMEGNKPTIKIEDEIVSVADLEKRVKDFVKSTGKRELFLEVDGQVPWGVEAAIHDAAKGAEIHQIYRKPKKSGG